MRARYRPCESAPPTPIGAAEIAIAQLAAIQERLMRAASGQFAPSQQGVEHGESNIVTGRGSLGDPNAEECHKRTNAAPHRALPVQPGDEISRKMSLKTP